MAVASTDATMPVSSFNSQAQQVLDEFKSVMVNSLWRFEMKMGQSSNCEREMAAEMILFDAVFP